MRCDGGHKKLCKIFLYKLLTFARYPSPAGLSRARDTRVVFGRDDTDDILASLSSLPDLQEMPRLDHEQAALDRGCTTGAPNRRASLSTSSLPTANCASWSAETAI